MSTGLLTKNSGADDYAALLAISNAVAKWWNETFSARYGFLVVVSSTKAKACCDMGTQLFTTGSFPESPGPFKRIGALLVLGRLHPLFDFHPFKLEGGNIVETGTSMTEEERIAWLTRILVLCIPATFGAMQLETNGHEQYLDEWEGFPSPHYRLEFMAWLRWLDYYGDMRPMFGGDQTKWEQFLSERLSRMVMSASLIVEASYYLSVTLKPGAAKTKIQGDIGECLKNLDEDIRLDLYYDSDAQVVAVPDMEPPAGTAAASGNK